MSEVGKECRKSARPKYINPMIDGGFKILFGSERSKELTESLLSAILGFEVAEVTFLNTEALPAALDEKPVRYDILCEDREGGRYLLEMQVKGHPGLLERTFYYMRNLKKFAMEEEECGTMMEKWLYNLKNMSRNDKVSFAERDEVFRKLREYAEENSMSSDERLMYDLRVDAWKDYYADMDESMAEGFEKGKKEGLEEGKAMVARNMKNAGMSAEVIAAMTGLTEDEAAAL